VTDPTALDKLKAKLKDLAIAANGPNVFIDRQIDDPLQDGELPGQVVRIVDVDYRYGAGLEQGQTYCNGRLQIDFQSDKSTENTIDAANSLCVANFIRKLHEDRTLGGMVQSLEETNATADAERGADVGCTIVSFDVIWFQPRGDFFTIVGMAGATF
jgi:hypothetical protein